MNMTNDQPESSRGRLRTATAADLPRVMEIERLRFPDQWACYQFEAALQDLFLVYEQEQVQGFLVGCSCHLACRGVVARVAVHPDSRGRGIATLLLQEAIDRFEKIKFREVELNVDIVKTGAINLYERLGFKVMKVATMDYNDSDESFYIMKLSFNQKNNKK